MHPPELDKLRRFCLTLALILVTYVAAGINIDTLHSASVLGLPLTIVRPNLVLAGLMIASIYSTARYWYYAFLHIRSPRKRRKKFMSNFHPSEVPDMYRAAPMDAEQFRYLKDELPHVFPDFPRQHALLTVSKEQPKDAASGKVALYVPNKIRYAAWFEDLDYSSPIWMNLLALPLAALHMFLIAQH